MTHKIGTPEILTITALAALGLCLIVRLGKEATESKAKKATCDRVCSALLFIALALLAVGPLVHKDNFKIRTAIPPAQAPCVSRHTKKLGGFSYHCDQAEGKCSKVNKPPNKKAHRFSNMLACQKACSS